MQKPPDSLSLTFRVSTELDAKLEQVAEALGLRKASAVRLLLASFDVSNLPPELHARAEMMRELGTARA